MTNFELITNRINELAEAYEVKKEKVFAYTEDIEGLVDRVRARDAALSADLAVLNELTNLRKKLFPKDVHAELVTSWTSPIKLQD